MRPGRVDRPADRHEDLDGAVRRDQHAGRPVGAPAEVADERLQLVERRPDVVIAPVGHRERRDGVSGERPDDDVRLLGTGRAHLDADVERGQPAVDLAPLALELQPPSVEGRSEVRPARDEPADLGQAEAHVAERHDPAELRQLGGRVVPVVCRGVHPDGPEQSERVVRAEDLRGDTRQPGERTDREHAGSGYPLTFPHGQGSGWTLHPRRNPMRPIRIAAQLHPQQGDYRPLRDGAVRAEELGYDIVYNWDHFFPLYGDPDGPHLECWTRPRGLGRGH